MPRRIPLLPTLIVLLLVLPVLPSRAWAGDHEAPSAGDAADYPAVDIHAAEQVAIAADPYNTPAKIAIFRLNYLKYGFMPIRIIITNNGNTPISLADAHITFITGAGDTLETAEAPDVERRIDKIRNPDGGFKLPGPLPRIGSRSAAKSKDIEADFRSFEYSAAEIEPHTTRAGFFFYDLGGIAHPLAGAALSLSALRNAAGKELFPFEISFDKYLAAMGAPD